MFPQVGETKRAEASALVELHTLTTTAGGPRGAAAASSAAQSAMVTIFTAAKDRFRAARLGDPEKTLHVAMPAWLWPPAVACQTVASVAILFTAVHACGRRCDRATRP